MEVYYNSTTPKINVYVANTRFLLDWQSRGQRFDPAYLHQSGALSILNKCLL